MKITHLTTLKHKLQWLVLLTALLGVSQGVWGTYTINAGTKIYVDATNFPGDYSSGVYIAVVTDGTNGGKLSNINKSNTSGVVNYVPSKDAWYTNSSKTGNVYTFTIGTKTTDVYGILISSKNMSGYGDIWEVNVSGVTTALGDKYMCVIGSSQTKHNDRRACCSTTSVNQDYTDKTIYFDNSQAQWSNVYLGRGHTSYSCFNTSTTRVSGTHLYKVTADWWFDEVYFFFSNLGSWECQSSNYYNRICGASDMAATRPKDEAFVDGKIYSTNGTGSFSGSSCTKTVYEFASSTTNYSTNYTVTITAPTGGIITVGYTDTSGASQSSTSDIGGLKYTTILTITATPNSGYRLSSLIVDGNSFTSGNSYVLKKNITISATFEMVCVNPKIDFDPVTGAAVSVCASSAPTLSVTASSGNAPLTYQWYQNTENNNTTGSPVTDALTAAEGGASYTPDAFSAGTPYYYYCVVRSAGSCATGYKATSAVSKQITIKDTPLLSPTEKTVKQYEPVKITSTNTAVDWEITTPATAPSDGEYYLYDETRKTVMFKGEYKASEYVITATPKSGSGCSVTSEITVEKDDNDAGCP